MRELKKLCLHFKIPSQDEKIKLIENIQLYLTTGKINTQKTIPEICKAQPKKNYTLAPQTLILKGSFKNDLKTRMFLKKIVGDHFHYTAYGIDWIKNHWEQGTPQTYSQFASYWQSEYIIRKNSKPALKPEWAYLNFLNQYKKNNPTSSKSQAIAAWKTEREIYVKKIKTILNIENF
jgi:hypothetical protein